jgi:MFS family permease
MGDDEATMTARTPSAESIAEQRYRERRRAPSSESVSTVGGTLIATYLFAAVMVSTTLPTPLYAIYAERLSLKPFMITVIFAVYAIGVMAALLTLGRLSDHIGRKPVLLVALAVSVLSGVVFMTTENLPGLFAGRLLSGVSAGLVTGAATAYISELYGDRTRGGLLATIATMGGLGLGPLISGILAEHAPAPTQLPYGVGIALLLPALVVLAVPDTVPRRPYGLREGIRPQRLGVPHEIRLSFAAAGIAGFVGFALLGFITSLVGSFLAKGLSDRSHQTAGIVTFLVFAGGTVGQLLAGRLSTRTATLAGLVILPVGVGLITGALPTTSLAMFVTGAVIGGVGVGYAFRAAVVSMTTLAPARRRGEVLSTFFLVAYVGLTVPIVGAGILITTTTLLTATITLAVVISVLAAAAVAILLRLPANTRVS